MEALEDVESPVPVQIFATDISDRALERARAGEYLESAVRDVTPDRLKRYFVRTPGGYQISKTVRDLCIFARQNVTADPPFSGLDLLSCRNLLIYLDPHLQERIFPAFHYALKRGGFLLLGRSESLGKFGENFHPYDRSNRHLSEGGREGRDSPRRRAAGGAPARRSAAVRAGSAAAAAVEDRRLASRRPGRAEPVRTRRRAPERSLRDRAVPRPHGARISSRLPARRP